MIRRGRGLDPGTLALGGVTVLVALLGWESRWLLSVKTFIVLLHEISHGLAALLTGGSVERLQLVQDQGGLAFTRGGSRFLILSAGYLGSALWGALFLRLSRAGPGARRRALQGIALGLGLVLLLAARDLYTLLFVTLAALVVAALAWRGAPALQAAVLWVTGTLSCLYALFDISSDILSAGPLAGISWLGGPSRLNDAEMLADITRIPAFFWGLLWISLALAIYVGTLLILARRP